MPKTLIEMLPQDGVEAVVAAIGPKIDGMHCRLLEAIEPYREHLLKQGVYLEYLAYGIEAYVMMDCQ